MSEKTQIGALEVEKTVVYEQDKPVNISLTREVTPEDVKKFGEHYLQIIDDDGNEVRGFKYIDVVQTANSDVLVKAKEGSGWTGIWMGQDVQFTILEVELDEADSPLRVAKFTEVGDMRALPKSKSRPEGKPFTSPF